MDVDNGFSPCYVVQKDSKKHLSELKKLCGEADAVILATDEDREGESISWHLLEELKPKVPVSRIAFHEITKSAIDQAMANTAKPSPYSIKARAKGMVGRSPGTKVARRTIVRKAVAQKAAGRMTVCASSFISAIRTGVWCAITTALRRKAGNVRRAWRRRATVACRLGRPRNGSWGDRCRVMLSITTCRTT